MMMQRTPCVLLVALAFVALAAAPVAADHNNLAAVEPETPAASDRSSLDVDLKLGLNGFRLGARVFGQNGYSGGAWINGETRPEGFSVDGRLEREGGKSWNFKLNADIDEALRRAAGWWGALRGL
jgi:hypothetical protein